MSKVIDWSRLPKIHPDSAKALTPKEIKALFSVGRDLAKGKIRPITNEESIKAFTGTLKKTDKLFNMGRINAPCGSPMCIAGHTAHRLGRRSNEAIDNWFFSKTFRDYQLNILFDGLNPDKPKLAAKAIYRYLTKHIGFWPKK